MATNYAIQFDQTGGPEVLKRIEIQPRPPGLGEVLVEQSAIGLNFIDTYHRSGLYPVKLPFIPGSEGAGRIVEIGDGVDQFQVGDRVAYLGSGTYQTHFTGPVSRMIKLPDYISDETAAAVLLKGLTAWMLLFEIRRAGPGDRALVWAPVGGVGSLLLPWARALGVDVIAVTSSEEKAARARALGARDVVMRGADIAERVRTLTNGEGVDVSYDSVGKTSALASLDSLKPRGWWISYGNASGAAEPVAPTTLAVKGSLILTRPSLFNYIAKPAELTRAAAALFGALQSGTIKAHIGQKYQLTDVQHAHQALADGITIGATILLP